MRELKRLRETEAASELGAALREASVVGGSERVDAAWEKMHARLGAVPAGVKGGSGRGATGVGKIGIVAVMVVAVGVMVWGGRESVSAPAPSHAPALALPHAPAPAHAHALAPDELTLISRAQDALRGSPKLALELLAEHERLFSHGMLVEEREVLRIDAERALGRLDPAAERARAFVKRFPRSPQVPRLQAWLSARSQDGDAANKTAPELIPSD